MTHIKSKRTTGVKRWDEIVIFTAIVILIILFLNTGLSKVFNRSVFVIQLGRQPLTDWSKPILSYALPLLELSTVIMLFVRTLQKWALWVGSILMCLYTTYAYIAYIEIFGYVPCACGKIFEKLSWQVHFYINLSISILSILALVYQTQQTTMHSGFRRKSKFYYKS